MRISKYILAAFCFVFLVFSVEVYSQQIVKAVTIGDKINIRVNPDLKSKIITQINKNTVVDVLSVNPKYEKIDNKRGHWVYVQIDNKEKTTGWVFDAFLSFNYLSSPKDKYLGKVRLENNPKYYEVIYYEKYVILGLLDGRNMSGFSVYINKQKNVDSYDRETPVYTSPKNEPACFMCIYDDYLFTDYGTSPGHRGLKVSDLTNNTTLFEGSHYYPQIENIWNVEFINDNEVYVYNWVNPESIKPGNNELIQIDFSNLREILDEAKSISNSIKKNPGYSPFEYSLLQKSILNYKTKKVIKTNIYKIVQEQG